MANAYMTHGDLYARDPYCAFYQAVWRAYGPLRSHVAAGERMPASDRVADADR